MEDIEMVLYMEKINDHFQGPSYKHVHDFALHIGRETLEAMETQTISDVDFTTIVREGNRAAGPEFAQLVPEYGPHELLLMSDSKDPDERQRFITLITFFLWQKKKFKMKKKEVYELAANFTRLRDALKAMPDG